MVMWQYMYNNIGRKITSVTIYGITAKVNKTTPKKFYSSARHNRHNQLLTKPVTILYNGKY